MSNKQPLSHKVEKPKYIETKPWEHAMFIVCLLLWSFILLFLA